ncbi:MAG: hypothetical protein ACJ77K_07315 [Bacteroidia bacterium]
MKRTSELIRRIFMKQGWFTIPNAILLFISVSIFSICIWKQYPDIPIHNEFVHEVHLGEKTLPVHFLYFLILLLPELLFKSIKAVNIFSVIILSVCVLFKYRVVRNIFSEELSIDAPGKRVPDFVLLMPLLLMICENLIYKPSATMFLGYLPVNTWHNSTTIFLMPFALLLFYRSYQYVLNPGKKLLIEILVLVCLNLVIKPSFLLCFVPVFPLFALLSSGWSKRTFASGAISLLAIAGLYLQTVIGKYSGSTDVNARIAPFNVWAHWGMNIPLAFICSVFFPLLFLVFYPGLLKKERLLKYSWMLFLTGTVIFILLSESGVREYDGNFAWQVIICNFMLFLATALAFGKHLQSTGAVTMKDKWIAGVLVLHFLTGCLYLLKSPMFDFR